MRFIILVVLWLATLSAAFFWFMSTRVERLAIAAGPSNGEAFKLANVIAQVFNQSSSNVRLDVFETGGSADNARLLEAGQVAFATIQADTRADDSVTAVASLYADAYQLIVSDRSEISRFNELAGKRVAIAPEGSGQNSAFWFAAEHYGLSPDDMTALPMSEDAADFAMIMGQVDAVFRVRAPGNISIRELVRDHPMQLVPIKQAEALSLQRPALRTGMIPAGAYRGSPSLPVVDLPTPVLERMLVARADLQPDLVTQLTRTLFESHSEMVSINRLAGFIKPFDAEGIVSMPLHPGARLYYDREKPGFWQQNTRMLASLLYVLAILSSLVYALRARLQRAHKVRVSDYSVQLMEIADQAGKSDSVAELRALKERLLGMLQQIVTDLSKDRVTREEFEHFSFTWQAVDTVVRDRLAMMPKVEVNDAKQ